MKVNYRSVLILFIGFSIIGLTAMSTLYFFQKRKQAAVTKPVAPVSVGIKDFTGDAVDQMRLTSVSGGKIEWEMRSTKAVKEKGSNAITFQAVEFRYSSKDGNNFFINGAKGSYDEDKGILKVTGKVNMHDESGYTVYSNEITYKIEKQTAEMPGAVKIESKKGMVTEGEGLTADIAAGSINLSKKIKTVLKNVSI
ncbi:MAG: LPS export ABC transporter periplasmic protein LptC [Deltaproteobacteria bacterium]|nr:LPS export ABC transporter periplasmic protein LptC [Deltaproteobacteria bacterium]